MTAIAVFLLLAILTAFFAWEAHFWHRKYDEAMDGWRYAQDGWLEALGIADEYDAAARRLIGEVDSAVIRVWAANN